MKPVIKPEPAIIVIFGITGDLVKRKLFPALYNLMQTDLLNQNTRIIGITRQKINTQDMINSLLNDYVEYDDGAAELLKNIFEVHTLDVDNIDDYKLLQERINSIEDKHGMCMNRLFYLSIPPQVFGLIVSNLGKSGLNAKCLHDVGESRILVEKPFGYNLDSAKKLINESAEYYNEEQIFRIDHYLAKETVQNILNFRFNNAIFEELWNKKHIALIEISATETLGIEGRTNFYDHIGALRDIIQSHLLQLMAIITMDEPKSLLSDDIHKSKLELLQSVIKIENINVNQNSIRGQYESYKAEVEAVSPDSFTETFAAIKVLIDLPKWENVPIIIKTGKSLNEKKTDVKVLFRRNDNADKITSHNSLTFRIQPNEGIDIGIIVKKPGLDNELELVDMDFSYSRFFAANTQHDAYERVLVDAVRGDHTLFATSDEIIATWEIINEILVSWSKNGDGLQIYNNNSTGPKALPDWLKHNFMT